jgi:hypothetical protein
MLPAPKQVVVGLIAVFGLGSVVWAGSKPTNKENRTACSRHGTEIDFFPSPSEAAAAAKKAEKLVFVLHVSGHFETPEFT